MILLLPVVLFLAIYVAFALVLHLQALFAGSLFLFYWLGIEKAELSAFLRALAGAIGGTIGGSLFQAEQAAALGLDPVWTAVAGLFLLILAIYLLLIHAMPFLVNQAYMLFLTVAGIPQLGGGTLIRDMIGGVIYSAFYCGITVGLYRYLAARRAARPRPLEGSGDRG